MDEFEQIFTDEMAKDNEIVTNQSFEYYMLINSPAWEKVKTYLEDTKFTIISQSKSKEPSESLESYAAKRIAADSVEVVIDNFIQHIEAIGNSYES